ncbi:lipid-A-disaccharide synthase [Rhizobiales bacterium]|uniref:lipid-A-disaccharide synthase n=1 Tax=Hongsoonwoonella zoysiae TaxID=2821844 RepID=UPI00155F7944|nr:lipid-A-disaccharide synthase [Hongsoonwoonella zoysiae]NRG18707.1 lipid-A-disaccharide synthase [Hongsoonwoonella zoysiae]
MTDENAPRPFKVFIVVGEESGDQLGARLMHALRRIHGDNISFEGTGGERMAREGLQSIFSLSDIAVMGLTAVLQNLRTIIRRVHETVDAAVAARPDVLVIIDSPDFTHNVAKRVRKRAPEIPIVDYVSPSVWAWRPGRARKMARYVDHLLAVLPFEPDVHKRLGGPPTTYVGHPLIERLNDLRPASGERPDVREVDRPTLLILPGSRRSEVSRLLDPFGKALEIIHRQRPELDVLLPAVPHLAGDIREKTANWPVPMEVVVGEEAKFRAFRRAHAALAASGTVSLELAISSVPMVVAYKLDWFYRRIKDLNRFIKFAGVDSMVLPNIILEKNVIPEFLDDEASPESMAQAVLMLLDDSEARSRQLREFATMEDKMRLPENLSQSGEAARIVSEVARAGKS